jgi:hypothetical protein
MTDEKVMFTVQKRSGREIVSRSERGRFAGGASLMFVRWMHGHVPRHQLNADQAELVEWYDKYKDSDKANETVPLG